MSIGRQLVAWRAHRGLSQAQFAGKGGVTRAYLARLEAGRADPSLSVLLRLASGLGISVGQLLEECPPHQELSRDQLDELARSVFHPNTRENKKIPQARALARIFRDRRAALGLYRPRKSTAHPISSQGGHQTVRRLRATLGEKTWQALLQRIDKHAAFQAKPLT